VEVVIDRFFVSVGDATFVGLPFLAAVVGLATAVAAGLADALEAMKRSVVRRMVGFIFVVGLFGCLVVWLFGCLVVWLVC
jgi:hypothetical protein